MIRSDDKIQLDHLQRRAYIYVRQSSPQQVLNNQESRRRQYALRERAIALGWPPQAVVIIDDDQGTSSQALERPGFQQLFQAITDGEVGALFNTEVSRLARENSAWCGLMQLCGWQDTLLIDERTVYDPNLPDDRLLLGIQGLLSEAELYRLQHRLQESREAKARRGELRFRPPTGLVHDVQGRLGLDPDEEVQGAVRLLFTQFQRLGSAAAVVRFFHRHKLMFPTRHFGGVQDGTVEWKPLDYQRTLRVLHNPLYAGAYAYGRRAWSWRRKPRDKRRQRSMSLPPEDWLVLEWDAFSGYISREEYEANQRQLAANNRSAGPRRGVARSGAALLTRLVLCGLCGRPMQVVYHGTDGRYWSYVCRPWRHLGDNRECQRVPGTPVDPRVAQAVLAALTPAEIELSLQVLEAVAQQAKAVRQQWERRLERARYTADLARRRYQQVEPEHRLVVRTLEREWEEALAALVQVEQAYAAAQREKPLTLSEVEREQLLALARDVPALWEAETTTLAERKAVVRLLIADVSLTRRATDIRVQLRWITNSVDEWTVPLPQRGMKTDPVVLDQVRALAPTHTDAEIAAYLNANNHRTARGNHFTRDRVRSLRYRHQIGKVRNDP